MKKISEKTNNILKEDKDVILEIPLKELVWTIICYTREIKELEEKIFENTTPYLEKGLLIRQKEYKVCRSDELARIISQYTSFDVQRIWEGIK